MKFSVDRASFFEAVMKLQKITTVKTALAVLEGILISAEKGMITLSAYNLATGMKKEMYANTEVEGDIVISGRILSDIVRKVNGEKIEIEADEKLKCTIKSGDASFEIMGMAAMDFPEMPSIGDGESISLESQDFLDAIKGTIFAVSTIEGTRPILTGINISIKNNVLQLVAIDGYRLAIRRKRVNCDSEFDIVVFGKAILEVLKLLEESEDNFEITIANHLVLFNINGFHFICRIIEGEFVNFEKIIPETHTKKVNLSCKELINAVERVSLIINDTFSFPIRFNFDEKNVKISSATSVGRASENLNILLEGEGFEIGLNSKYLLEALRGCEDDDLELLYNNSNSGIVLRSANNDNNDFLYLIMPMRLK